MNLQNQEQEMRRRREEQRRAGQRRNGKKTRRAGRKRKVLPLFMLAVLLVGAVIVLAYTVLFPVRTVTVEGNMRYSEEEIVAAAGIVPGENLLRIDPDKVSRRVRDACPYISHVKLGRKLPDKAIITVTEAGAYYAFYQQGEYVLTNAAFEWIETARDTGDGIAVYGLDVTPKTVAKPVTFNDDERYAALQQLGQAMQAAEVTGITQLDLTDLEHVRMRYQDRHEWQLGSLQNVEYKLRFGMEISSREGDTGIVNLAGLSSGKNGYFKSEVLGEFVTLVTPTDVPDPS